MIPIQIETPTLYQFSQLRYVSGINPLFRGLSATGTEMPLTLSYLGIYNHFLSNVNLMLFFFVLCPILWLIFRNVARFFEVKNWEWEARLRKYANSSITDLPFSFLLFNSFNICVSLTVGLQYLHTNVISTLFGVLMGLILVAAGVLFCIFRNGFIEFNE